MTWRSPRASRNRRYWLATGSLWAAVVLTGCGSGGPGGVQSSGTSQPVAVAAGPQLGYTWNTADSSLRPILGVPGSSQIGAAIAAPGTYIAGATSAMTGSALLEEADGSLVAMHLPEGAITRLATGMGTGLQLGYAPSGKYAIAYSVGGTFITLVSGLPGTPVAQRIPFSAAGLLRAAVGDNGQVIAASQGSSGAVISAVSTTGQTNALAQVGKLAGLAMIPQQDGAVAVDAAQNAVVVLHNISTAVASQSMPVAGLSAPAAIGVSQDARWAVVANGGEKSMVRVDLTNGTAVKIACACQPNQVSQLLGNAVFRVNDIGSGPGWMIDASPATPKTLFIPAIHLSGSAAGVQP